MYRLRHSPASPYVRKVMVFAHEAGLAERIAIDPADVWSPQTDIFKDNPLGRVPALTTPEGTFVGSFAICDYLDQQHQGAALIPRRGPERWRAMQIHGLADGAIDSALIGVIETLRRPKEVQWASYVDRQVDKIEKTLDTLEARAGDLAAIDIGSMTTGCLLGYLDFRFRDRIDWRARAPKLADWFVIFDQRPSMRASAPK